MADLTAKGRGKAKAKTATAKTTVKLVASERQDVIDYRWETVREFVEDYNLRLGTEVVLSKENRYPMLLCTHLEDSEEIVTKDGKKVPAFKAGDAFPILFSKALSEKLELTEEDIEEGIPVDADFMEDKVIALVFVNGNPADQRFKVIARGKGATFYDMEDIDF